MGKIRGTHSSPGVYTKFTDISYAAKTLGITTLGVVGETLKGPAFEPIAISSWTEYIQYFGGKSPEKYDTDGGSKYPRYELPYIAESYLSAADQMYVCRVLGLSGYNAGPAYIITADKTDGKKTDGEKIVVAVLRSRGKYTKYVPSQTCGGSPDFDKLVYSCNKVEIDNYNAININPSGCGTSESGRENVPYTINASNYGKFTLKCTDSSTGDVVKYPVSLNPIDKDYIFNVLGSSPTQGKALVYVEELYDMMLEKNIFEGNVTAITSTITTEYPINMTLVHSGTITDFVRVSEGNLGYSHLGKKYICSTGGTSDNGYIYAETDNDGNFVTTTTVDGVASLTTHNMTVGDIYEVKVWRHDGKKTLTYVQAKYEDDGTTQVDAVTQVDEVTPLSGQTAVVAKVAKYDKYYYLNSEGVLGQVEDASDYKEQFRCAMTPWIVSDLQGSADSAQVHKLFRFYTISDGNASNTEVKISITGIDPDEGTFNVLVRDFNDTDSSISVLESYKNLTMVPGDKNYIGLRIGTVNGDYASKSKYILVEVVESDITERCVPCGFLGYPMRKYNNTSIATPSFNYNMDYDDDISTKKQYFGLSDITGIDTDMLSYKGRNAYTDNYCSGYTRSFHLDARLNEDMVITGSTITVDGDSSTSGIKWDTVSPSNVLDEYAGSNANYNFVTSPEIASSDIMETTIYNDKNLRKFTLCFYGGFDGWDIYREYRTNTDEFKATKYKGSVSSTSYGTFTYLDSPESYALSGKCITSDYYAFLGCINQFENPEMYPINLFATPGIDYVNNLLLVNDAFDMVEEKNVGALYIVTTPDKPFGAEDDRDQMYAASDAAENLLDSEIDTYYGTTYYPWVKYYDSDNYKYINLPATKDVVRNMADVDNKKYPWYAPAGLERGKVKCVKAHMFTKLEDEDAVYDERINPIKTFAKDGVIVWGNKTMYSQDTPMNRVNVVRLMLYMRKLIIEASRKLIFDPNDATLKSQFERLIKPILEQIQKDRGITAFRLDVSQTTEQMDAHEMSCVLWVKPTPTLEYIEIEFMVTPQGVEFGD